MSHQDIDKRIAAALAEALAPVLERVTFIETLLKNKPEFLSAYVSREKPAKVPVDADPKHHPERYWIQEYEDDFCDCYGVPAPGRVEYVRADVAATAPKPAAPCATCGEMKFICDFTHVTRLGRTGCIDGPGSPCAKLWNRRPCPDCSKPATSPEGEKPRAPLTVQPGGYVQFDVSCPNGHDPREPMRLVDAGTDGGLPWATFRCETCASSTEPPAPAATYGISQSGPRAPECPFDTTWLYWCPTYSGVHHIDTHAGKYNGTRTHPVQVIRYALFEIQKAYTDEAKAKLASAERRIAELEQRVRIAGEDMGIVAEQHLAVGREAGIREAAKEAAPYRDEILELLAKEGT